MFSPCQCVCACQTTMFLLLVGSSLDWIPAARTTHVAWRGSVGCFAGVTCVPHVLRLWIAFHMPESVLYWFCFSLVCVLFFCKWVTSRRSDILLLFCCKSELCPMPVPESPLGAQTNRNKNAVACALIVLRCTERCQVVRTVKSPYYRVYPQKNMVYFQYLLHGHVLFHSIYFTLLWSKVPMTTMPI